jgi:hypothetical protein
VDLELSLNKCCRQNDNRIAFIHSSSLKSYSKKS